jgi:catechol 2,3-dioxygenase-like lactoylglutathione lyase family enzyme
MSNGARGFLRRAFGYQGDAMNLPVADLEAALPFYETPLGFRVTSRGEAPPRSAVLARDDVQMRLVENSGDSSQDGCAFHVTGVDALRAEFAATGLKISSIDDESHDDGTWRVFYVVAPDGLCYWFGEKQ